MRVAIVGGKLQGVEASYLAQEAGWEVVIIDKDRAIPATGLCNSFCCIDVNKEEELKSALKEIDLIVPALENKTALESLKKTANQLGIPLLFDSGAYELSSSKAASNQFFKQLGVPAPQGWPGCSFPVIVKPSEASGSDGVIKIRNLHEYNLHKAMTRSQEDWIVEEYLEGPSYSIEVIGFKGHYKVLQVTELQMDSGYDCKRVLAPANLPPELIADFENMALTLARRVSLEGVMDVETILHHGKLKVLEIDARLPSQTPTAVYKSTGINMLQILGEAYVSGKPWAEFEVREERAVIYEHIRVLPYRIEVLGEHIMAETQELQRYHDFFGADEVITDYIPGKSSWSATLIITGVDRQDAWAQRCRVIERIQRELGIGSFVDLYPTPMAENLFNMGSIK